MDRLKVIYPLSKSPLNENIPDSNVFENFYNTSIFNNEQFEHYLFQIHRHIRRLLIDNGKLFIDKNNELVDPYEISMVDFLSGMYYQTDILKKMISQEHVYEWRIHRSGFNPRGIFFPFDIDILEKHPGIIYCYAFIKREGYDPTQKYVENTQLIRDKFYNENLSATHIGEEIVL